MKTFASLFSGFGGADMGAMAAGLTPVWGVEYVKGIADVANANLGNHVQVANILALDPADFAPVDVLHASPPCPNFSVAKADGIETAEDIALARKVADFVATLRPGIFTLENVWAYRNSKSWRLIEDALYGAGYWLNIEHVNAANFGVPQTRKRMIVRASRGGWVPMLPEPEPWVGWLAAISDLIDDLPETQFAPWQLARLPEEIKQSMMVSNVKTEYSDGLRSADDPALSVTPQHNGRLRAFLMGKNQDKFGDGLRQWSEPAQTIGANEHGSKAFIADVSNTSRDATIRQVGEPCFTVSVSIASRQSHTMAALGGRVVAMTPRCLARFQSFSDWYQLPASTTLAAKGIGNAVPPLLMQKVYTQLLEY